MRVNPDHNENIVSLKRIEGQIRGIQRMIEEKKYCINILTQIQSARAALARVERQILQKHIENCVENAIKGKSFSEKNKKLEEVFLLLKKL